MVEAIQQETMATVEAMHSGTQQVESGVGKTEATGTVLTSIRDQAGECGEQATRIAASAEQQSPPFVKSTPESTVWRNLLAISPRPLSKQLKRVIALSVGSRAQ